MSPPVKNWFERTCYGLGSCFRSKVRRWRWIQVSLTGTDEEAIQAEREAGRDLAKCYTGKKYSSDKSRSRTELVRSLGNELAKHVGNKRRRFDFAVLESGTANAFALPGGFIFITRPLVELCDSSREEIAAVLGHEMAHVIRGHARDRLIHSLVFSALARLLGLREAVRRLAQKFALSAYSQEQEFDADRLGVRLIGAAGYPPEAAVRVLQRLEGLSAEESSGVSSYLASHPPMAERIGRLRARPQQS